MIVAKLGTLVAHAQDRDDYQMFVGIPAKKPTSWGELQHVTSLVRESGAGWQPGIVK